ncbi:imelysin family protein [Dokdonia sp. Asnod3-C12]|uniref:imelysin family protein n=1 Tax=Dokdonia sp. Asnod3-C12 TaxID=3160575 RepID=UPI00386A8957
MKKIFGIIAIALFFYACGSDDTTITTDDSGTDNTGNFDRSAMLTNWADNIIVPGYVDFSAKVNTLESATAAFTADASDLTVVRAAWLDAYKTWQRVSMFEIGPAETVNLRLNVNIYPANVTTIESNIDNGSYDFGLSSNRSAKGFPAIDYLLYGLGADETAILAVYNGTEGAAYKQYLNDVVADMKQLTASVLSEWQGSYRAAFIENDGASATASTDRFVNDYIFYYEKFLRAGKMGIPGGVFSGNVEVGNLEALYAGNLSKDLFLVGLDATQDFFNGTAYNTSAQGESLSSYLDELNAIEGDIFLSSIINNQFDVARASVTALGSFESELSQNPPSTFLESYNEVQRLVPLLKVDMVSAMSISIDFADADGD